jgi:hypothetical protein
MGVRVFLFPGLEKPILSSHSPWLRHTAALMAWYNYVIMSAQRKRDEERRAAETQEQRQARLQRKHSRQSARRFSAETDEQ